MELSDGSTVTIALFVGRDGPARDVRSFGEEVVNVTIDPDTRLLAKWTFGRR